MVNPTCYYQGMEEISKAIKDFGLNQIKVAEIMDGIVIKKCPTCDKLSCDCELDKRTEEYFGG